MATRTFNIAGQNIQANVEKATAQATLPSTIVNASIQLTDPSNQWGNVVSITDFIQVWGIQVNHNDGQGWFWWVYQGDTSKSNELPEGNTVQPPSDQSTRIAFGSRDRAGGMPTIFANNFAGAKAGDLVRLAIVTNKGITLGATIIVS